MGTTTPKIIDINVNINTESNDRQNRIIKTSINQNNPSTIININSINNGKNETTQNNTNNDIYLNQPPPSTSLINNSKISFNNSFTNQPFNINEGGTNTPGIQQNYVNKKKNYINKTKRNIDINSGGNKNVGQYYKTPDETKGKIEEVSDKNKNDEKYYKTPDETTGKIEEVSDKNKNDEKYYKTPDETTGKIKKDSGNNKNDEKYYKTPDETTGKIKKDSGSNKNPGKYYYTPDETAGKIKKDSGSNKNPGKYYYTPDETAGKIKKDSGENKNIWQYYTTPDETPYSKTTNTENIEYLSKTGANNNGSVELGQSRNIVLMESINNSRNMIYEKEKEGFFPIFMKIDEYKPLFFFVLSDETLGNVLKEYKNVIGITDDKEYTLYNKNTQKIMPKDVSIEDLGINKFTYISNI